MQKPKHRSKLRRIAGILFYRVKRQLYWHFSKIKFAQKIEKNELKHEIFIHQTFLRRPLKDVDMWMQENKIKNLEIALKELNGLILEPGEIFSYWRQIGNPTQKKGYVEGMLLRNGMVVSGVGGGLCQLSNLIYWMTLHTPLMVVERWRHSYDVFPDVKRNQPFGSGATCSYPNIDLQIQNNTTQRFQLSLKLTPTHLVGQWLSDQPIPLSYEVFEKSHEIKMEWWGGYSRNNLIFRRILDVNKKEILREELVAKNEAVMMYSPFLEEPEVKKN